MYTYFVHDELALEQPLGLDADALAHGVVRQLDLVLEVSLTRGRFNVCVCVLERVYVNATFALEVQLEQHLCPSEHPPCSTLLNTPTHATLSPSRPCLVLQHGERRVAAPVLPDSVVDHGGVLIALRASGAVVGGVEGLGAHSGGDQVHHTVIAPFPMDGEGKRRERKRGVREIECVCV